MTSTTIPYSPADAGMYAKTMTDARLGAVQEQLDDEYEEALALAGEYADHLATGGDPTLYPKPHARDVHNHGLIRTAREAVFAMWNDTRPRKSVGYPWGQGQPFIWLVQEYLLDRLEQPVALAELRKVGNNRVGTGSPNQIAEAAWSIQVATRGELRTRKTKLDGKTAWLVRRPVEGDDLHDIGWRDGIWSSTTLDEERVADALTKPFKARPSDYPTEVQ